MDVEADLEDIRKPISPTPVTSETIEQAIYDFSNSQVLWRSVGKQELPHLAAYSQRAERKRYFLSRGI
ncbi:hypothetical protein H6F61_20970 [Cyanobacteria bacterium FACHB-472]|nr:hypothetical protein [Cyanobacteria bacterium FACHB-472]